MLVCIAEEDLELATRKGVVARVLRTRFDAGAIEEQEYLVLRGRIEGVQTREDLDAVLAEVEKA